MSIDAISAYQMIGRSVRVELDIGRKSTRKRFADGRLVTVDPTSGSVVLAICQDSCLEGFELIPGCSVVRVEEMNDNENLEINEKIEKIMGFSGNSSEDSEEDIQERCSKIVNFLKSHHIDVVEKTPGSFVIAGIVKFESPYMRDNLYCDIPIVLQRILKLVDQIK